MYSQWESYVKFPRNYQMFRFQEELYKLSTCRLGLVYLSIYDAEYEYTLDLVLIDSSVFSANTIE